MQDSLTDRSVIFSNLAGETEAFLEDIFISGFHSLRQSIMDQADELLLVYKSYGMKEGFELLSRLKDRLAEHKDSFSSDTSETMHAYAQMEFYVENMKGMLRNS